MRGWIAAVAVAAACTGAALAADTPVTTLARPPFPGPALPPAAGKVRFEVASSRSRPITGSGVDLAGKPFLGNPLLQIAGPLEIYGPDGSSARYVVAPGRYAFDFAAYARPPRIAPGQGGFVHEQVVWAKEAAGTLYVETAHSTYASASYGRNGYLSAIDLHTGKLRWRSAALVANAGNFVLAGDLLISGYGFTREPDYLYALDSRTGKVVARLLVPNAPERIVRHGTTFEVDTYDRHLVVHLVGE